MNNSFCKLLQLEPNAGELDIIFNISRAATPFFRDQIPIGAIGLPGAVGNGSTPMPPRSTPDPPPPGKVM